MPAISFALTFPNAELAKRFVVRIAVTFGAPCLRDETMVYVAVQDEEELQQVLDVGRQLSATNLP
jgi:hypothetical protein